MIPKSGGRFSDKIQCSKTSSRLPVDQKYAGDAYRHAEKRQRRQPLVEKGPGQQRRHRRRQIEQADDAGRCGAANEEIERPTPPQTSPGRPGEREQKLRREIHDAGFKDDRAESEQQSRRRILYAQRRTPIDAAAEALLIKRADGDADQRHGGGDPGQRRRPRRSRFLRAAPDRRRRARGRGRAIAAPRRARRAIGDRRGQHRCRLTISATSPAERPFSMATKTPPR